MTRSHTEIQFCHELGCHGNHGVEVHRVTDPRHESWIEPAECTYCDGPLFAQPADWRSAMRVVLEVLEDYGVRTPHLPLMLDEWALARAITNELERQRQQHTEFLERQHAPTALREEVIAP